MCAQPTQWWNPVDVNCFYSADGLAKRFSNGDATAYQAWFDVLIKKDWAELKAIETVGSAAGITGASRQLLDNAAIIPGLFLQNPRAALLALQQYGCQNRGTLLGSVSLLVVAGVQSLTLPAPTGAVGTGTGAAEGGLSGGGVGIAAGLGILVAVGGLILWNELTREQGRVDPAPPETKRRWVCNAQCNVEGTAPQCNNARTFGYAEGPDEASACVAAKRMGTQSAPRGCYARHCKCDCYQI